MTEAAVQIPYNASSDERLLAYLAKHNVGGAIDGMILDMQLL